MYYQIVKFSSELPIFEIRKLNKEFDILRSSEVINSDETIELFLTETNLINNSNYQERLDSLNAIIMEHGEYTNYELDREFVKYNTEPAPLKHFIGELND